MVRSRLATPAFDLLVRRIVFISSLRLAAAPLPFPDRRPRMGRGRPVVPPRRRDPGAVPGGAAAPHLCRVPGAPEAAPRPGAIRRAPHRRGRGAPQIQGDRLLSAAAAELGGHRADALPPHLRRRALRLEQRERHGEARGQGGDLVRHRRRRRRAALAGRRLARLRQRALLSILPGAVVSPAPHLGPAPVADVAARAQAHPDPPRPCGGPGLPRRERRRLRAVPHGARGAADGADGRQDLLHGREVHRLQGRDHRLAAVSPAAGAGAAPRLFIPAQACQEGRPARVRPACQRLFAGLRPQVGARRGGRRRAAPRQRRHPVARRSREQLSGDPRHQVVPVREGRGAAARRQRRWRRSRRWC